MTLGDVDRKPAKVLQFQPTSARQMLIYTMVLFFLDLILNPFQEAKYTTTVGSTFNLQLVSTILLLTYHFTYCILFL